MNRRHLMMGGRPGPMIVAEIETQAKQIASVAEGLGELKRQQVVLDEATAMRTVYGTLPAHLAAHPTKK